MRPAASHTPRHPGWILLACLVASAASTAQISERISQVNVGTARAGSPLAIHAQLLQPELLARVELSYRQFGETNFHRLEMAVTGNDAAVTIPVVAAPILEYYFVLTFRAPVPPETYPLENPEQQPLKVSIETAMSPERLILLSPEAGESLRSPDVLISFSLINFDSTLDRSKISVTVDGADFSEKTAQTGDLVVLRPENFTSLGTGVHTLKIQVYDIQGRLLEGFSRYFSVAGPGETRSMAGEAGLWTYSSSLQLETRNENISSDVQSYNRVTLAASGHSGQFDINGKLFVTNEEKSDRQPQNRFFVEGVSPWLRIGYGDAYPVFPDLLMNGKRVRGITGNLMLGKFNLDISQGEIVRSIEGNLLSTFPRESLATQQASDPSASFDSIHTAPSWAKIRYGMLSRTLFVIRPSFGRRDESHIGFTYLKSKDDLSSIRYGVKPQENLVIGSDLLLTFDQRRLELTGQAAVSATNRDITGGTFTDEQIDQLYPDSTYKKSTRDNIRRIRDIISPFITVNENLVPLSAKNLPTLSYEATLFLNYFSNSLRISALRHGESYESFGQSFLRTDVGGYSISDRVRIVDGQISITAGVERMNDNTADTKASTTTGTTANIGVSYYPRTEAPSVTVAYLRAANSNGRPLSDTLFAIEDRTNRVIIQLGKSFVLGEHHTASLSVSTSSRDDQSYRDLDTRTTSVSLNNITRYSIPLETSVGFSVSSSMFALPDTSGGTTSKRAPLSYTSLTALARYRLAEDRLRLQGSVTPTLGDIQRVLVDLGSEYFFAQNLSLQTTLGLFFNSRLYQTAGNTNDIIWSIVLRAGL